MRPAHRPRRTALVLGAVYPRRTRYSALIKSGCDAGNRQGGVRGELEAVEGLGGVGGSAVVAGRKGEVCDGRNVESQSQLGAGLQVKASGRWRTALCWDRISLQFAARLVWITVELGEGDLVLHELDHLECLHSRRSLTKPETQFKHAPLHPLWHKHYSAARHMPKNLSTRWGLYADGNRDAIKMLQEMVTPTASDDTEKLVGNILHQVVVSGYEERAERGLTGDWIIFGRQNGLNFYLDVVPHSEAPEHVGYDIYGKAVRPNFRPSSPRVRLPPTRLIAKTYGVDPATISRLQGKAARPD